MNQYTQIIVLILVGYVAADLFVELLCLIRRYREQKKKQMPDLMTKFNGIADNIEAQYIRVENLSAEMVRMENLYASELRKTEARDEDSN